MTPYQNAESILTHYILLKNNDGTYIANNEVALAGACLCVDMIVERFGENTDFYTNGYWDQVKKEMGKMLKPSLKS